MQFDESNILEKAPSEFSQEKSLLLSFPIEDENDNFDELPEITYRPLIAKLDRHLIWLCILIYLTSFLNRVNVANIQTELLADGPVGMNALYYSTAVSVFFVGDILSKVPSNLLLRQFGPRIWLSILLVLVGIMTILSAFVIDNIYIWIGIRGLLGVFQGGCFPGLVFYLTQWYRPRDCGYRYSLLFSASLMASATSGLLASLIVESMDSIAGLKGWQWLLCIEGCLPFIAAVLTLLLLPNPREKASFLDEDENRMVLRYLDVAVEHATSSDDDHETRPLLTSSKEDESPSVLQSTILNVRLLLFCVFYYFCCVPNAALQFFLPIILQSFGLSSSQANWVTVPVYLLSMVFMISLCVISDKRKTRPPYIFVSLLVCFIGFSGLIFSAPGSGLVARQFYENSLVWSFISIIFALFCSLGAAPIVPLTCSWISTFVPSRNPTALAIASGMMVMIGQLGGIVVPYIYTSLAFCKSSSSSEEDFLDEFLGSFNQSSKKVNCDYSWAHFFVSASLLVGFVLVFALSRLQKSVQQ